MKKLFITTLPFLSLSMLLSCGNQPTYIVNEQEFIDALNLKDVK